MSAWKKFVICGDNHGDKEDKAATSILWKFIDDWKPEIRIHIGDNWDFRPIRKGVDEEEARETISQDFAMGGEFLLRYRPNYFLRGNHDERLWLLAQSKKGMLAEYASLLTSEVEKYLKRIHCPMLLYDKRKGVLELGKLKIIHGYHYGVNAARRAALIYGSVVHGHIHSTQTASIEGIEYRIGRSISCLCDLNMPYASREVSALVHSHGFGHGIIHKKSGIFKIWQDENVNGTWVIPSDVKIYK